MDKVIETKSQMIMRIADSSEANERLQAENEKLKTDIGIYKGIIDSDKEENEQLKKSIDRLMKNKEIKTIDSEIALLNAELQQENKRLKARLRPLEDSYFKGLSSIKIAELAKKSIRITAENRKLEYTLQEIRELIKKLDLSLGCGYGDYDCDNCSDINEETICKIKLQNIILAKINEVIGAEE